MKKIHLLGISVLCGLLLSAAWPARGFSPIIFVALIPLIFLEDYIGKNKHNFIKASVFFYSYISFFIWNLLTTWWIVNSSVFGAAMAVVFNSLFMALVFHFYHLIRRTVFKSRGGFNVLLFLWIAFEFLHLNWDLSWSWLNLGNGLATLPEIIQWYEITGSLGGSLWVIFANILGYKLLLRLFGPIRNRTMTMVAAASLLLTLLIPTVASLLRYNSYKEKSDPYDCVVVQPNIDPYNEKFGGLSTQQQLDKIIALARQKTDTNTDFIICPETAIPEGIIEDEIDSTRSIDSLKSLIRDFPGVKIVIGISSYKIFREGEKLSETARYSKGGKYWYDVCNTAMYYDSVLQAQLYHKSKLVPGVEKMPFPKLLKPLEKFAINLGGMSGSHGVQEERSALGPKEEKIKIAPVICYESIYGDFVTGYIRNGAGFICIITNDGWWGNTPGHRQHCQYARIRAIETRRSIARSANTGISCFIDQRGDMFQATPYWEDAVIRGTVNANYRMTFYARFGDYLGKIALWISVLIFTIHISYILLNRRKKIKLKKKSVS
jgi:apolipoprotein N-acyltransferase